MSAAAAPPNTLPVVQCPYTASTCPLFSPLFNPSLNASSNQPQNAQHSIQSPELSLESRNKLITPSPQLCSSIHSQVSPSEPLYSAFTLSPTFDLERPNSAHSVEDRSRSPPPSESITSASVPTQSSAASVSSMTSISQSRSDCAGSGGITPPLGGIGCSSVGCGSRYGGIAADTPRQMEGAAVPLRRRSNQQLNGNNSMSMNRPPIQGADGVSRRSRTTEQDVEDLFGGVGLPTPTFPHEIPGRSPPPHSPQFREEHMGLARQQQRRPSLSMAPPNGRFALPAKTDPDVYQYQNMYHNVRNDSYNPLYYQDPSQPGSNEQYPGDYNHQRMSPPPQTQPRRHQSAQQPPQQHQMQAPPESPRLPPAPAVSSQDPSIAASLAAVFASNHGSTGSSSVTPFISKLSHLLSSPAYAHVIRWTAKGDAFVFQHGSPNGQHDNNSNGEMQDVLARFFRHANVNSFVRQLNIYGFVRLPTLQLLEAIDSLPPLPPSNPHAPPSAAAYSGFTHPLFWKDDSPFGREMEGRGERCDLGKIKPKSGHNEVSSGAKRTTGKRKSDDGLGGPKSRKVGRT